MYYVCVASWPSLLIESTDSMIPIIRSSSKNQGWKTATWTEWYVAAKLCSQTCKIITTSLQQQSQGGMAPNFRLMTANILAIWTVSQIKILPDAIECCQKLCVIIDVFQTLTFCTFALNGGVSRVESCHSSNDGRRLHCYTGRGMVSSSFQKITCPTIPGSWKLTTYSITHTKIPIL